MRTDRMPIFIENPKIRYTERKTFMNHKKIKKQSTLTVKKKANRQTKAYIKPIKIWLCSFIDIVLTHTTNRYRCFCLFGKYIKAYTPSVQVFLMQILIGKKNRIKYEEAACVEDKKIDLTECQWLGELVIKYLYYIECERENRRNWWKNILTMSDWRLYQCCFFFVLLWWKIGIEMCHHHIDMSQLEW